MKMVKEPSTVLYPVPAVLVSCGRGAQANIITLAWAGTLCSKPPLVGIGVRPSRHSYGLIQAEGEFVVNIPRAEHVESVDYCGTVSGRDEDKWSACGFTPVPAGRVSVPLIVECPVNVACRLQQTVALGSHDLFIGEILEVQVDKAILDEEERLDIPKADPFAYLNGEYRRIGDLLGTFGYSRRR